MRCLSKAHGPPQFQKGFTTSTRASVKPKVSTYLVGQHPTRTQRPELCSCSQQDASGADPTPSDDDDRIVASGNNFEPERLFQQGRLPNQAETISIGVEERQEVALMERSVSDLDFFTELLAIQQNGPKNIGFFGTRNMGFMHQQLIEILSYAMVLTGNHIFTSGATGTNAAVIKGALRAEQPDLLTVILPQSKHKQPPESQELLKEVQNIVEMPQNDGLTLLEASRMCNREIMSQVQQIICFAFHDSRLLLETCQEAKEMKKIVTLFYLD